MIVHARVKSVIDKDYYCSAISYLYHKGGSVLYRPDEWVPDEYGTLEQVGLVHCTYGNSSAFNSTLMSRKITLTRMGMLIAQNIVNVIIPSYVTYSFHSTLASEARNQDMCKL